MIDTRAEESSESQCVSSPFCFYCVPWDRGSVFDFPKSCYVLKTNKNHPHRLRRAMLLSMHIHGQMHRKLGDG